MVLIIELSKKKNFCCCCFQISILETKRHLRPLPLQLAVKVDQVKNFKNFQKNNFEYSLFSDFLMDNLKRDELKGDIRMTDMSIQEMNISLQNPLFYEKKYFGWMWSQ